MKYQTKSSSSNTNKTARKIDISFARNSYPASKSDGFGFNTRERLFFVSNLTKKLRNVFIRFEDKDEIR